MRNFDRSEFACPCCGVERMQADYMNKIDIARDHARVPFVVNSGYRCLKHNTEVGGTKNSSHMEGYAGDVKAQNNHHRYRIVRGLIIAGFTRILIYQTFIHADIDPNKPQEILVLK
jgi:zinc D-Ala-D-Ala carboxypeptidase